MKYRDPKNLPLLTKPVGIDVQIQQLQSDLSNISWLEYSFGRAYIGEMEQKGKDYTYPAVYKGTKNYQDASPNDNLKSQSFFVLDGDYAYEDYQINQDNKFSVPISLIVWGRLDKISNKDEHFGSLLLQDVIQVIKNSGEFVINKITDNDKDVFREFSVSDRSPSLFYYPYFCYRIKMTAYSSDECVTDIKSELTYYTSN